MAKYDVIIEVNTRENPHYLIKKIKQLPGKHQKTWQTSPTELTTELTDYPETTPIKIIQTIKKKLQDQEKPIHLHITIMAK